MAKRGISPRVARVLGGLFIIVAPIIGLIGVAWLVYGTFGEWAYCPHGGNDCIAGWKIGAGLTVVAAAAGLIGFGVLRRERDSSRSGERLT